MALVENEFTDIESTEHIIRNIEAREGKTRHSFQGIGHTTYLCFARKAFLGRKTRRTIKNPQFTETDKKHLQRQPGNLLKNHSRHLIQNKIYSTIS